VAAGDLSNLPFQREGERGGLEPSQATNRSSNRTAYTPLNTSSPTLLADMLWEGHRHTPSIYFEVQRDVYRRSPVPYEHARSIWAKSEARFFGPVPRKTCGNRKIDCVASHNVLFADIDRGEGCDLDKLGREIHGKLDPLGLPPSAVVFSGRAGVHLYWLLDAPIPIEEVQGYNKALSDVLSADHCWQANRILRVPGSWNDKAGGKKVELLHADPRALSISRLDNLSEVAPLSLDGRGARRTSPSSGEPEWLRLSHDYEWREIDPNFGVLTGKMWDYVRNPRADWRDPKYQSRSEMEMAIVYRLVERGASDEQIKWLASQGFPKHIEQRGLVPDDPDGYLKTSIARARQQLFDRQGLVSSPLGGWPKKAHPRKRHQTVRDLEEVLALVNGQKRADLVREIVKRFNRSRSAAYSDIDGLAREDLVEVREGRVYRSA
jgi:hypothetical protein